MNRLNDAIFLRTPQATLLGLGFLLTILCFSFSVMDFNHFKDGVLCLTLVGLGGVGVVSPLPKWVIPKPIVILLAVLLCMATYHVSPWSPGINQYTIRSTQHYFLVLFFIVFFTSVIPQADWGSVVIRLIVFSACVVALLAWIQYFEWASPWFPVYEHYPQPMYSVFGNQNVLGGYLAIAIPLLLPVVYASSSTQKYYCLVLLFLVLSCFITGSRSAWLAAFIGIVCVLPYRSIEKKHLLFISVVVLGLGAVCYLEPESTLDRVYRSFSPEDVGYQVRHWIWLGAVELIQDHWLMGVGPGGFHYFSSIYMAQALHGPEGHLLTTNYIHTLQAHSTPLDLIIEYGLAGWAICMAWLYALCRYRHSHTWGGAIAFSVYALFNSVSMNTGLSIVGLLLFIALLENESVWELRFSTFTPRVQATIVFVLILCPVSLGFWYTTYTPSRQLAEARSLYVAQANEKRIDEAYQQAVHHPWAMPQAHAEYGFLLLEQSSERAYAHLEIAALALDTGEIHFGLAQIYLNQEDLSMAAYHAEAGVYRWPYYSPGWVLWLQSTPTELDKAILRQAEQWGHGDLVQP